MTEPKQQTTRWPIVGALLGGLGASACCTTPLILSALGVGSGGLGLAGSLHSFRPVFIGVAIVATTLAFRRSYRSSQALACESGQCLDETQIKKQKITVWIAAGMTLFLIISPYFI